MGTLVTAEAFAVWRKKFEAEMRELEGKDRTKGEEFKKKLTGKQLFEQDANLYLQEGLEEGMSLFLSTFQTCIIRRQFVFSLGDVVVEVDETLFEDLNIEDDDFEEGQEREESQE